ncbi:hypothetical protein [Nonomuraea bangladeshensis]|uniref:hypothetical protein n=1 Tax=Nonomuraea bangladeshensis TaxID=404385 RepID=UPI003C2D1925
MNIAVAVTPKGDMHEIRLPDPDDDRAIMRREIGCQRVDLVAVSLHLDMWVASDMRGRAGNVLATALACSHGGRSPYFGTVILCGRDGEDNPADFTAEQARALFARL